MVGVTKQGASSFLRGRSKPTVDALAVFLEKFPQLNARWVLTGEGHMLNTGREPKTEDEILAYLREKKEECDLCQEKEKRIRELERLIEAKDEVISMLKKG